MLGGQSELYNYNDKIRFFDLMPSSTERKLAQSFEAGLRDFLPKNNDFRIYFIKEGSNIHGEVLIGKSGRYFSARSVGNSLDIVVQGLKLNILNLIKERNELVA